MLGAPRLYGRQPDEVMRLLISRRQQGYMSGGVGDGARLGLVVEGGAMRGVISCATVDALFQLGFGAAFDTVCGNSSGALNAAYFVSGQITLGTSVYYENATDPAFINLWRWPDPLDVNWLFNNWITRGKALDVDAVMRSPSNLWIATTDIETGELACLGNRTGGSELIIPAIRASCSTPMFVTHREPIGGRLYNDGMIRAAIPLQPALADRCTHLVVALTWLRGYHKDTNPIVVGLEKLRLMSYSKAYRDAYHQHGELYNEALDRAFRGSDEFKTLVLPPEPGDLRIKNSETRAGRLIQAVEEAYDRVAATFGAPRGAVVRYGEKRS